MKEIVLGLGALVLAVAGVQPQKPSVNYSQTIRPLIAQKCLPCHSRASQFGPFDLSTYVGVTSRIELIRTQVLSQSMPPVWAHSDYGRLALVEQFTDEEAVQLQDWIRLKMPMGPPVAEFLTGGKDPGFISNDDFPPPAPSLSLAFAKKSKIRAEGLPYWTVHSVPLPKGGGKIDCLELIPSNPRVIRYATVAIVPIDMKLPSETTGTMDLPSKYLIGTWAPGYGSLRLPRTLQRTYGANQKMVVQVHYRPLGKVEDGSFRVEIYNPNRKATKEPSWITLEEKDVMIPAGKSKIVELVRPLTTDISLLTVLPEARFYAGRVELLYTSAQGANKTVFNDMRWDPYWIGNYSFQQPVKLAKGGTLTARFYYDNDEFCRINEGKKPKPIRAGPSASDEVCRMHLLIAP